MKKKSNELYNNDENCLSRRKFLQLSGLIVSGAALGTGIGSLLSCDDEEPVETCITNMTVLNNYSPEAYSLWIKYGEEENYYNQFKQMIEQTTDFSWLGSGDSVLLKLALNSGNTYPMTTDPWLLDCMIKVLKEKGASRILVGDQSGAEHVVWTKDSRRGSSRELCESAGLLQVIEDNGAEPIFFEEEIDAVGYENAYVAQSPVSSNHWNNPIYVTRVLDQVDHIVYLPRVASHLISNITSGLKLGIGFLRDDSRLDLHQAGENFYKMYEEIGNVPLIKNKLRLIVSSGRKILRSDGPDNGSIEEPAYGLVFASTDLLANEILAYALLEAHNHVRSELIPATPTFANNFLIDYSFQEVDGFEDTALDIPEFTPGVIFCHPSIINFLNRKGGRPKSIVWNQLNSNPDSALVKTIQDMIVPA